MHWMLLSLFAKRNRGNRQFAGRREGKRVEILENMKFMKLETFWLFIRNI